MLRSVRCAAVVATVATVLGLAVFPGTASAAPGDTTLVSDGPLWADGAAEGAYDPSVSADGRYVAFTSAYDTGPDSEDSRQVYVRDRQAGTVHVVSVRPDGQPGNLDSFDPSISADGRYVAYTSFATDIVTDGPESQYWNSDVYRYDRVTGTTVRASGAHGGGESDRGAYDPAISGDGRYVAFGSPATNLIGPADPDAFWQQGAYRRDLDTGALARLDVPAQSGWNWSSTSGHPAISGDGRYVTFVSDRFDLDEHWGCACPSVYRRDVVAGVTARVSVASDGTPADVDSTEASMSADGRFVAFQTAAALTPDDTNGVTDVFLRDVSGGTTTRVSVGEEGAQLAAGGSGPAVSGDGGAVAFVSASAADGEGAPGATDVYVRRLADADTRLASRRTDGGAADAASRAPALDETGGLVVFASRATTLAAGDTDGRDDVFAHEAVTGVRARLTIGEPTSGWAGGGVPVNATLTAQGLPLAARRVRFTLRDAAGEAIQEAQDYTDELGLAEAWLSLPLTGGDYLLDADFEGDATYPAATRRATFVVRVRTSAVEYTGATSGVRGEPAAVSATLRDGDSGYVLDWREVRFELRDGEEVVSVAQATTDHAGRAVASMYMPAVALGQYSLVTRYDGEPGRDGASVTTPFSVGLHPTAVSNAGPVFGYRGEPALVRAWLVRDGTGEPLPWQTIRFTVERNGEPVAAGTGHTDMDGYAETSLAIMVEPGAYDLRIAYEGETSYAASAVTVPYEVRLHPVGLTYTGDRTAYAFEGLWLRATLTDLDRAEPLAYSQLTYTLLLGDEPVRQGALHAGADGVAETTAPAPPAGEYTLRLRFGGDDSHSPATLDVPVTVRRHATVVTAAGTQAAYVGQPLTYDVAVADPETGATPGPSEVLVVVRDAEGVQRAGGRVWLGADGTATATVFPPELPPGTYDVAVEWPGNEAFEPAAWHTAVEVTKRPVTVEYLGDVTGSANQLAFVRARVTSPATDALLSWREMKFVLLDEEGVVRGATLLTVDSEGYASGAIELPGEAGTYTMRATYDGGTLFESGWDDTAFEVVLFPSELTTRGATDAPRGESATLGARLANPTTGEALGGRTVTFTLRDGTAELWTAAATTGADGVATAALVTNAPAGTYELVAAFAGDATQAPARATTAFTVRVDPTELTYTGETTGVRTEPAHLAARLVNTYTGLPLAGRAVEAELRSGGTVVASRALTTDADGWARGDLALDVPAGDYTLVLRYAGATADQPSEVSRAFTVTLRPVTLTYGGAVSGITGHEATLAARLVRADTGEALAGRPVTFTLGTATATGTTGADGVAEAVVTLPVPGTYDVTASVAAAGAFAGGSALASVAVAKVPAVLAYQGGTGVVSGEQADLAALLTRSDTGAGLDGREVTFSVHDGDDRVGVVTAPTDGDGTAAATWVADVPAGTYTVEVTYDGDALTEAASATATLTVTKRATTLADLSPASGVRGTTATLVTVVTDTLSGAPVAGREVTFRLGTLTATAETDGNGRASAPVRLDLVPGTYDLTVTSAADDRRAAATVTRPFTVRWQYSFADDTGLGTVHLNVTTKEFQFAGRTESSAIVHDPSMTVTYGVGGSIVEVNYRSAEITLVGTFQLSTGRFNANVTTPRGYYVLKRV